MGVLTSLRRLYSLDTLDSRFTNSATSPPKTASDSRAQGSAASKDGQGAHGASSSKWNSLEFYIYYVILIFAVSSMVKTALDVSKESHPAYPTYSHLLSPGWIWGRKVDNTDTQYSSFRDNIPYMAIVLVVHPCIRQIYNRFFPIAGTGQPTSGSTKIKEDDNSTTPSRAAADLRLHQRVRFDLGFGLLFIVALHGFSASKVLLILSANYLIATRLSRAYIPAVTWIFNIGLLFANELLHGYPFSAIGSLVPWIGEDPESTVVQLGHWLDGFSGLIPRWEVLFKITILRLISFNLDYYWSLDYRSGSPIEKKQLDPATLSERDRVSTPAQAGDFNFRNYVAYALYSPLYLAGPIVTFNDYISQQRYPLPSLSRTRTVLYGIRFILTLLCMELILHYIYVVAISKSNADWFLYTPFQLSMLGYFTLHHIWLKLLIPWRFFRLWALLDGIDPPENMVRCMSNNYSALAFWRGWHRSFNRWVVRYLYIPLGGAAGRDGDNSFLSKARGIANLLGVFTFVALWHDINLRLLMWGWLIVLFVLPEIIATILFPARKWQSHPNAYRMLCGLGAVASILMMMMANLVGFAIGLDGVKDMLHGILGSYSGITYMISACVALFVASQAMFEIREGELRAGINLKC